MFYSLRCGVAKIHRDNRSRAAEAARVLMILRSDPFNDSTLLVVLIFQSVPGDCGSAWVPNGRTLKAPVKSRYLMG